MNQQQAGTYTAGWLLKQLHGFALLLQVSSNEFGKWIIGEQGIFYQLIIF